MTFYNHKTKIKRFALHALGLLTMMTSCKKETNNQLLAKNTPLKSYFCGNLDQYKLSGTTISAISYPSKKHLQNGSKLLVKFMDNDNKEAENIIKDCFIVWEKYANIQFEFVEPAKNADIRIKINPNHIWNILGRSHVGKDILTIEQTKPTMWFWQIKNLLNSKQLKSVALHEIGHTLGLDHDDSDEKSIMKTFYDHNVTELCDHDIALIGSMYPFPTDDGNRPIIPPSNDEASRKNKHAKRSANNGNQSGTNSDMEVIYTIKNGRGNDHVSFVRDLRESQGGKIWVYKHLSDKTSEYQVKYNILGHDNSYYSFMINDLEHNKYTDSGVKSRMKNNKWEGILIDMKKRNKWHEVLYFDK